MAIAKKKGMDRLSDKVSMNGSVLHEYYTNFDAKSSPKQEFTVLKTIEWEAERPDMVFPELWWKFKTNLDPDDFAFQMTEGQVKSFLRRMWEIYRYRKAV